MFSQIFFGIIGIALGFVIIWKSIYIVDHLTGRNAWAERTFGGAGTYTLVKLLGILIMFISLFYAAGFLQKIILGVWNLITGGSINS
jgi:small-conductance mechanosensitive channel